MKNLQFSFDDIKSTTVFSIAIHLLALFLFLVFQVAPKLDIPEFVEVSFTRGTVSQIQPRQSQPSSQPEMRQTESVPETNEEKATIEEKIDLPKRRMLEEERPELNVRKGEKRLPDKQSPSQFPNRESQAAQRGEFTPETPVEQKEGVEPGMASQTDKMIPDATKAGKPGMNQSFEIEGKAAERKILQKVLPAYPQGYNREGTIRIRFTILANGWVGEMIPVQKTDAVLEQNAMDALAKWRFNPLPQSAPQQTVEGIITFRYKLN
jgi:TonB family protein